MGATLKLPPHYQVLWDGRGTIPHATSDSLAWQTRGSYLTQCGHFGSDNDPSYYYRRKPSERATPARDAAITDRRLCERCRDVMTPGLLAKGFVRCEKCRAMRRKERAGAYTRRGSV